MGSVTITQEDIWAELDKYMANELEEGEFTRAEFQKKYGLQKSAAQVRLNKLELEGVLVSRQVPFRYGVRKVYRLLQNRTAPEEGEPAR